MPTQQPMAAKQRDLLKVRCNPFLIWITPIALFAPYMLTVYVGTLKLTPGKLLTLILVIPAIFNLANGALARRRSFIMADFFAIALTFWLVAAPITASGSDVIVGAASQGLEFFGSYVIGRAYFYGSDALSIFGRALAVVVVAVTMIGLLDTLTHHYVVSETLNPIFYSPGEPLDANYPQLNRSVFGVELLRAASTFDHPILFGMFCSISACVLIYMQPSSIRLIGLLFCGFGCVIALSSAAILALGIAVAFKLYDLTLMRAAWRWKALLALVTIFLILISIISNNPVTWIIRNLTFDPQTGYFRILVWDAAMPYIHANFWTGKGAQLTGNPFVDGSVDSIWLGLALAYGIPAVTLLALIGVTVVTPARGSARIRRHQVDIDSWCTGFSLAIILFGLIGFTVFYWNGVWLYAAFCLGVRASLKEYCKIAASTMTNGTTRFPLSSVIPASPLPLSFPIGAGANQA
ncbi:hypothetical protein HCU64_14840 [Methylobacterium sp. C25]|uniref:O-antigen ligase family protein n=1 Tax=Methylobacterium sp. C25 TaxID=2721622 RepID=UPI001F2B1EDC|nr:O-antigen ligase family protein [Methylobacterium sp. C25]MCE4225034.1 hypothetical protein [Methylobacterium sp. C25]